jgi:hypothetical protein
VFGRNDVVITALSMYPGTLFAKPKAFRYRVDLYAAVSKTAITISTQLV